MSSSIVIERIYLDKFCQILKKVKINLCGKKMEIYIFSLFQYFSQSCPCSLYIPLLVTVEQIV